jgi:hypothetical protein
MRRLVTSAFGIAVVVGAFTVAPARATCMETFNKFGIRYYSCAAPGGEVHSYLCYQDTCREV